MTMKKWLSRRTRVSAAVAIVFVTVLAGTAFALSNITLKLGTVASYDFGGFGPGYPVPGTIQIHAFTMNPGDAIPWHYHKGTSFVILAHGTLTELHLVGSDQCASEEVAAGSAFVESPGQIHTVTNTGHDRAVIWWATIFPKSDGIVRFSPEFEAGGVYPVNAPNCN
jgi:hypothetical protein